MLVELFAAVGVLTCAIAAITLYGLCVFVYKSQAGTAARQAPLWQKPRLFWRACHQTFGGIVSLARALIFRKHHPHPSKQGQAISVQAASVAAAIAPAAAAAAAAAATAAPAPFRRSIKKRGS